MTDGGVGDDDSTVDGTIIFTMPAANLTVGTNTYTVTGLVDANCTQSSPAGSADITVNELPDPVITAPSAVCEDSTSNAISVGVTTGLAPYTYAWSVTSSTGTAAITIDDDTAASTSFDASGYGSIDLTVVVTDDNGCSNSDTVTITINPKPDTNITGDLRVCEGGGGYSYSIPDPADKGITNYTIDWTITSAAFTGDSTPTVTISNVNGDANTSPMVVTVVVTDTDTGCSSTGTLNVPIDADPTVTINEVDNDGSENATTCENTSGHSATANVTYVTTGPNVPTPNETYFWTITNGTIDTDPNLPTIDFTTGDYDNNGGKTSLQVVVQNNGSCETIQTFDVNLYEPPTGSFTVPVNVCELSTGNAASFALSNSPVNVTNYQWTVTTGNASIASGQGSSAITFDAGSWSGPNPETIGFDVVITYGDGCTSETFSVNTTRLDEQPSATITAPSYVCEDTPDGSLTPFGITMPDYAATVDPGLTDASYLPATYAWSVVSGPATITSATSGDFSANPTGAITFQVGSRSVATTIVLEVTVTNGSCSDTTQVTIPVNDRPETTVEVQQKGGVTFQSSETFCEGDNVRLQATVSGAANWTIDWYSSSDGGASWNLMVGATTTGTGSTPTQLLLNDSPHARPLAGTTLYSAVITDNAGCMKQAGSVATVYVRQPTAAVSSVTTPICYGAPVTLDFTLSDTNFPAYPGTSWSVTFHDNNGVDSNSYTATFTSGSASGSYTFTPDMASPASPTNLDFVIDSVTDGHGCTNSAISSDVVITVNPDTGAPTVTPPANITIFQSMCDGSNNAGASPASDGTLNAFVLASSAVDDCDATPTLLAAQVGGVDVTGATFFPVGTTTVTFRWQDDAGNIGTATATVTVEAYGDLNLDGNVDSTDLVIMANYLAHNLSSFAADPQLADLNGDSVINVVDQVLLQNYLVHNINCLPQVP